MKTEYRRGVCTFVFVVTSFILAKKQPERPSTKEEREDGECVCVYTHTCTCIHVHIHSEIFRREKEGYPAICNNMDGP